MKVAERTIYRRATFRKIPAFKVGGAWRFAKPDIERWIREQTVTLADGRSSSPIEDNKEQD